MLTLQNFPTEFPKHNYLMYVQELEKNDSKYSEYTDFVKECSDFLEPLSSSETWKEFLNDKPIEAKSCQASFDVLNELEKRYNEISSGATNAVKSAKPASVAKSKPSPAKSAHVKTNSSRSGSRKVSKLRSVEEKGKIAKDIPIEVKFIRRYIALDGKELKLSRANVLLSSLQKAITGKQIRKTSKYAKEIQNIQKNLIKLVDNYDNGTQISIAKETVESYSAIIAQYSPMPAISLLKAYSSLIGKTKDKHPNITTQAKRVYARLSRYALKGRYAKELEAAKQSVEEFIDGSTAYVRPTDMALRGLLGLGALNGVDGPISSTALADYQFQTISLAPRLHDLIGEPENPFKILIHGLPGSGKTTLAMRIAHSLAEYNQMQVLFVSAEEGISFKAKKRLDQLGLYSPNMYLSAELPSNLQPYDVVAIDSITTLGISPEELRDLFRNNPSVSFILISQSTKSGTARGSLEYEHDADITIRCDSMVAYVVKNRFGECTSGSIR